MRLEIDIDNNQEAFINGFIEAFYFADTGEDSQPDSDSDLAPETMERIKLECLAWLASNDCFINSYGMDYQRAGNCFYLSRLGHGIGFFDETTLSNDIQRDWLQKRAEQFGDCEFYLGDNGLIYL